MVGAYPVHAGDNIRRVSRSPAVEDADTHQRCFFGDAVLGTCSGSSDMRAVSLAVVWRVIVIYRVVTGCDSASEIFVRGPNSRIDYVNHHSATVTVTRVGGTQGQAPLI